MGRRLITSGYPSTGPLAYARSYPSPGPLAYARGYRTTPGDGKAQNSGRAGPNRSLMAALSDSIVCSAILRMIAPETFSHLEEIKKRAGHLWRFL